MASSSSSSGSQPQRPVIWDPQSPSSLLLVINAEGGGELQFDTFLADDGAGCNKHEQRALMLLAEAHEAYYATKPRGQWKNIKELCKSYRKIISDCLSGWEEDDSTDDAPNNGEENGRPTSLELLKVAYAVVHVSDVYLLTPPSEEFEDMMSMQGSLTADTVRYLRLHHMEDAFKAANTNESAMEEILQSPQPEQFDLYWDMIKILVLRGCVEDAWSLLSRHSLCRRSFSMAGSDVLDEYHAATLAQDRESFRELQAILQSAPLPGGRSDQNDTCFNTDVEDESNETVLDGLPPSAYKLWENNSSSSVDDLPLSYNPHAAKEAHSTWHRYLIGSRALAALTRRVPQLQPILEILRGEFDNADFSCWGEALCSELLYLRPTLRPEDMHVRASRIRSLGFGEDTAEDFDNLVLNVMQRNAGQVIQALHTYGGGSGAALPETLTALLSSLLNEANIMPPPDDTSSNIQTDLLLSASEAILSSLNPAYADLAILLSTRILLPYATPRGDVRIMATLGETLERYAPQTDVETKSLLNHCRKLVERKCVHVLDGCVGMVLSRYRHHVKAKRPGGAVHWLLQGIEFEKYVYASNEGDSMSAWQRVLSSGVCGGFLTTYLVTASQALLKSLVKTEVSEAMGRDYDAAKEMVESIREDDNSSFAKRIPEVKLLIHVFDVAHAFFEEKSDEAMARNIVACLEETADEDDSDVVAPLAHPCMYNDLLKLAIQILHRDEDRHQNGDSFERFHSSFDVDGIHVVMSRFTQGDIMTGKLFDENGEITEEAEQDPDREALCKGLTRAFVRENSERKKLDRPTEVQTPVGAIRSTQLGRFSRLEQESAVGLMLGPSI